MEWAERERVRHSCTGPFRVSGAAANAPSLFSWLPCQWWTHKNKTTQKSPRRSPGRGGALRRSDRVFREGGRQPPPWGPIWICNPVAATTHPQPSTHRHPFWKHSSAFPLEKVLDYWKQVIVRTLSTYWLPDLLLLSNIRPVLHKSWVTELSGTLKPEVQLVDSIPVFGRYPIHLSSRSSGVSTRSARRWPPHELLSCGAPATPCPTCARVGESGITRKEGRRHSPKMQRYCPIR